MALFQHQAVIELARIVITDTAHLRWIGDLGVCDVMGFKKNPCGNQGVSQCHPQLPLNVQNKTGECKSLSQQGNQVTTKMGGSHILASGGVTQMGPDRFNDKMTCPLSLFSTGATLFIA